MTRSRFLDMLTWRGRINRKEFFLDLLGLSLWMMLAGLAFFASMILGSRDGAPIAWAGPFLVWVGLAAVLFNVAMVLGVIARRAHDVGWSAYLPVGLGIVGSIPIVAVLFALADIWANAGICSWCSRLSGVDLETLADGATVVWFALIITLQIVKGQSGENRFGAPPAGA